MQPLTAREVEVALTTTNRTEISKWCFNALTEIINEHEARKAVKSIEDLQTRIRDAWQHAVGGNFPRQMRNIDVKKIMINYADSIEPEGVAVAAIFIRKMAELLEEKK